MVLFIVSAATLLSPSAPITSSKTYSKRRFSWWKVRRLLVTLRAMMVAEPSMMKTSCRPWLVPDPLLSFSIT